MHRDVNPRFSDSRVSLASSPLLITAILPHLGSLPRCRETDVQAGTPTDRALRDLHRYPSIMFEPSVAFHVQIFKSPTISGTPCQVGEGGRGATHLASKR